MSGFEWDFPYASHRMPVLAGNVVATSQPLAAQAGLRMLLAGGNAADAIVAAAAALTVVEPSMNGIGSDAFGLVWDGKRLHGLNASGHAPAAWTPERFAGHATMPVKGWDTITVPGAVSAWAALSSRHGRLPFEQLLAPAIEYASGGFLVSPTIARQWHGQAAGFRDQPGFAEAFMPGGRTPQAGERFVFPDQAATLRDIASSRGESFYRGELARRIVAFSDATGGSFTLGDLAATRPIGSNPSARATAGTCCTRSRPTARASLR